MAQGQIYVQVDANAVNNGIMTMDASGGGDHTGGSYWLHWTEIGFQGHEWSSYWDETPLKLWWEEHHIEFGYDDSTVAGLTNYLTNHPDANLDNPLENWSTKGTFVGRYMTELGVYPEGCIEFID